jgi:ABC-type amino acid transport system permease subunit
VDFALAFAAVHEVFALVGLIYFIISYPTAKLVDYIEARLDIHWRRPEPKPMHA